MAPGSGEISPAGSRLLFDNLIAAPAAKSQTGQAGDELARVAGQFEALFVEMMLKSMRQSGLGKGLLDNDQSEFFRQMYDRQLSEDLSRKGALRIADLIVKQLRPFSGENSPVHEWRAATDKKTVATQNPVTAIEKTFKAFTAPAVVPARKPASPAAAAAPAVSSHSSRSPQSTGADDSRPFAGPADFVARLFPHAAEAARQLGLPPALLLAQVALETGWGKKLPQNSHNLFGIKANPQWRGRRVASSTLEVEDGIARKQSAWFRGYESFQRSFQDYVELVKSNPRYRDLNGAKSHSSMTNAYIHGLQSAGYATDPDYADKVLNVMNSPVMKTALAALKDSSK